MLTSVYGTKSMLYSIHSTHVRTCINIGTCIVFLCLEPETATSRTSPTILVPTEKSREENTRESIFLIIILFFSHHL